ncbi:unnamed protein product [Meganyctiphanes norvegica]|uniref:NADH dehydrogenase subunit 2 n=1 Tax=Meganyctiphanes norvegica TaxID=48144 RepID=A0AAV2SYR8_MEGNR
MGSGNNARNKVVTSCSIVYFLCTAFKYTLYNLSSIFIKSSTVFIGFLNKFNILLPIARFPAHWSLYLLSKNSHMASSVNKCTPVSPAYSLAFPDKQSLILLTFMVSSSIFVNNDLVFLFHSSY